MAIQLDALQGLTAKQRPRLNSELCTPDHWLCFLLSLPPSTFMRPLCTGTRRVFPRVTLGRVSGGGLGYSAEHTAVTASAGQVLGTHLLCWLTSQCCLQHLCSSLCWIPALQCRVRRVVRRNFLEKSIILAVRGKAGHCSELHPGWEDEQTLP